LSDDGSSAEPRRVDVGSPELGRVEVVGVEVGALGWEAGADAPLVSAST
jgi:hypothetical protein